MGEKLLPWYVYILFERGDENRPRYVGKGCRKRVFQHRAIATKDNAPESSKNREVQELAGKGLLQELIISRHNTEAEAYAVESVLIKWVYGMDQGELLNKVAGHQARYVRSKGDFEPDRPFLYRPPEKGDFKKENENSLKAAEVYKFIDQMIFDLKEIGFTHEVNFLKTYPLYDPGVSNGHVGTVFSMNGLNILVDVTKTKRPRVWVLNTDDSSEGDKLQNSYISLSAPRNEKGRYLSLQRDKKDIGQFENYDEFIQFMSSFLSTLAA